MNRPLNAANAADFLNALHELQPSALDRLFQCEGTISPENFGKFLAHPTVPVGGTDDSPALTMLGVINGLLGATNGGVLTVVTDKDQPGKILRFGSKPVLFFATAVQMLRDAAAVTESDLNVLCRIDFENDPDRPASFRVRWDDDEGACDYTVHAGDNYHVSISEEGDLIFAAVATADKENKTDLFLLPLNADPVIL